MRQEKKTEREREREREREEKEKKKKELCAFFHFNWRDEILINYNQPNHRNRLLRKG